MSEPQHHGLLGSIDTAIDLLFIGIAGWIMGWLGVVGFAAGLLVVRVIRWYARR